MSGVLLKFLERLGDKQRAFFWCLALTVGATVALRATGQPWWCSCGEWVPWNWRTISSHNSQHFIDAYSFTHFTHGLIFFGFLLLVAPRVPTGLRLALATAIECGWELLENSSFIIDRYRAATISLNYYGDSVLNSVADIVFCIAGYLVAARLPGRVSLALFLLIEVGLLVTIRDSLAINILMLVYPIDAVRVWQQGAPLGL